MKQVVLALAFSLGLSTFAQETPELVHRAKINYQTTEQLQQLSSLGVPMDHGVGKAFDHLISDFSASQIAAAESLGLSVDILINDVTSYYTSREYQLEGAEAKNAACPGSGGSSADAIQTPPNYWVKPANDYMGFYELSEIYAEMDEMHTKYPTLMSPRADAVSSISTHQGRKLQRIIMTNQAVTGSKPQVLFTSNHHAREANAQQQTIFFMWWMLDNYATNPEVADLIDNTEIHFIPMVNPDGYVRNQTTNPNGGGNHRKNMRSVGTTNPGVDLNRNYPVIGDNGQSAWNTSGTSSNTNNDVYPGTGPLSEPESQTIERYVRNRNFVVAMNAHTSGDLLLYPFGYDTGKPTPDDARYQAYSEIMVRENDYDNNISASLYAAAGDSDDFMYQTNSYTIPGGGGTHSHNKIHAFTPEVGGTGGFWPNFTSMMDNNRRMVLVNFEAVRQAHKSSHIVPRSGSTIGTNDNVSYDLQRIGWGGGTTESYTVSIDPVTPNIIATGTPKTYSLTDLQMVSDNLSITLIGGTNPGDTVTYDIVVDNGVYSSRYRQSRIAGANTAVASDSATNFSDWTQTPAGSWDIETTNGLFVSAPSSFTESDGAAYQNNEDKQLTYNTVVDLSSVGSASVTFMTRFSIENNWDYAQFEVSIDGGNNWIAQCGSYTNLANAGNGFQPVGEPVYDGAQNTFVMETIDLSDYIGQSDVRFRFDFKTDGAQTDAGIWVDDFEVNTLNDSTLGFDDVSVGTTFEIYPNPARNQFSITHDAAQMNVSVYDLSGKMIMSIDDYASQRSIDTSNLSAGIYLVNASTQNSSRTEKLVIL